MLELREVSHEYGRKTALNTISLSASGGVVALVGVNGAGKSTLMSIAGGALRPAHGSVLVDGDDLYRRGSRRHALPRLSIMPQRFSFSPRLRTHEFVNYLAYLKGMSWRAAFVSAHEALELVGLADRKNSRLGSLSGGMLRRVALAQAIASNPQILILDEPTTGLDPAQRAGVRRLVKTVSADRLVVLSSHVMEDVEAVADRVVILHEGSFVFDGDLTELKARAPQADSPTAAEDSFLSLIESAVEGIR
ncbi:ABC transporter ATP-binding protein [Paractinoplanes ferrugineus]|uniref:ABC transporter ATP-binding protein n=2 Tax=Paractinoplanes ferrugineus TaxID=113564 RepID=A0A919J3S0_9ACTN|nr:ABC transporter ATP-binding protein [Actinoplanes ferrugineus]